MTVECLTEHNFEVSITHYDEEREYFFIEGCFINELSNSDADPLLSIAQARVSPGVTTRWHCLDGVVERYVIEQGRGLVEVGERAQKVGPGDVVLIPAGVRQRIKNIGDGELVFLALCTPRFTPSVYRDLQA